MSSIPKVSRRSFVVGSAAAAGGFSLGFYIPFDESAAATPPPPPREINAWVVIHPDERVVVRIARSEMGQGILTGLAQLVAEELECDWSKVTWEYPTPGENVKRNKVWGDFATSGSRGIRRSHDYVRQGGAAAREMLIAAAAKQWNVPSSECSAANSMITHNRSGLTVTYGKVAAVAATMTAPDKIPLKDPKDWKVIGKPLPRLDTPDKLVGKTVYGIDVKLPGMLNAAIKDCPTFGGKLVSFDAKVVESMPGVKAVVQVGATAVAVVADTWWRANSALLALPIVWDKGPHVSVSSETIAADLAGALEAKGGAVEQKRGDIEAAMKDAEKTYTAVYSYPYQNHAPMEPMNAMVRWTPERCEAWVSTQNGDAALAAVSEASGLPVQNCEVYKMQIGGGFGRRVFTDYVTQAVLIAKQCPGVPVKLIWSREEDMLHGKFHPTTQCKMTGTLDAEGNLTGLHMRIAGQSILAAVRPQEMQNGRDPAVFQGLTEKSPDGHLGYTIENLLIEHVMRNPPVPPGFWRGVNLNQNAFYLECFIEEMAHQAGLDPLDFRRKLMRNHPKHLAVLEALAKGIGWGTKTAPGVGRGFAQIMGFGSYVGAAAEVSINDGKLKIHKMVAATDAGHIVNPAQIERQVEGSFVYGLSAVLFSESTVAGGRMERDNFHTYNVMRLADMPPVEPIIMPSGGFWGGVGEPTIAVAGPAVLNALFAATGKRVRKLPLAVNDLQVV